MLPTHDLLLKNKAKSLCIVALGLNDYGPLVQGLIMTSSIVAYNVSHVKRIEIIGTIRFFKKLHEYYSDSLPLNLIIRNTPTFWLRNLYTRILFSSLILPLTRLTHHIIYLDDTGCLVPYIDSHVLVHSAISCHSYSYLRKRHISIKLSRFAIQRIFLLLVAHINRPIFLVQSRFVRCSLVRALRCSPKTVSTLDIKSISRIWHPLLGSSAHSSDYHTKHISIYSEIKPPYHFIPLYSNLKSTNRTVFCSLSPRRHKNSDFLIELSRKIPHIHFVCTLPLSYFNANGIPTNLHLVGPLDHSLLLSYIANSDVHATLFPSLIETYGLPILESILLTKPCIIPSEPFFRVHSSPLLFRYIPGNIFDASRAIHTALRM
jgi:glycosyltransferase involved in cell wall biosynthesis